MAGSTPLPAPRAWWLEYVSVIGTAGMLMGAAAYSGGITERLVQTEAKVQDLKNREDQRDKDQEANIEKLNAIDGRTIRIETTLSLLKPDKSKAP